MIPSISFESYLVYCLGLQHGLLLAIITREEVAMYLNIWYVQNGPSQVITSITSLLKFQYHLNTHCLEIDMPVTEIPFKNPEHFKETLTIKFGLVIRAMSIQYLENCYSLEIGYPKEP